MTRYLNWRTWPETPYTFADYEGLDVRNWD